MRFVQANKAYLPHIGGVETIVRQLGEGMAKRPETTSKVVACSDDSRTSHSCMEGVDVTLAGTVARIKSLPISPSYTRCLLKHEGDVLLAHEPFLLTGVVYATRRTRARRRFKNLVVWWHSDIVRQSAMRTAFVPLQRALLDEAAAVVVATPLHIESSIYLPEFRSKCHVIPFGIDPVRFQITEDISQRVARIHETYPGPLVLFSGRLVYYKGTEYLVSAMANLPSAQLVMIGKGPLRDDLELLASKGPGNVHFLNHLSEADLVAFYHAADIFVLPSVENSEAFGIVQLEAMVCGKPVITCNLPTGVNYVNQDGKTGLVVPKRDPEALEHAIRTLLENSELRRGLGDYARARVLREFSETTMVNALAHLCEDLTRR